MCKIQEPDNDKISIYFKKINFAFKRFTKYKQIHYKPTLTTSDVCRKEEIDIKFLNVKNPESHKTGKTIFFSIFILLTRRKAPEALHLQVEQL